MVMASIYASAVLKSARVNVYPPSDSGSLNTLPEIFRYLAEVDSDVEPPRKQRRLEKDRLEKHEAEPALSGEHCVLASIKVDLSTKPTTKTQPPIAVSSNSSEVDGTVTSIDIQSVWESQPERINLHLCARERSDRSVEMILHTTSVQLVEALRNLSRIGVGDRRISWSSCSLALCDDGHKTKLQLIGKIYWKLGLTASSPARSRVWKVFERYVLPTVNCDRGKPWSPQDFYDSTGVPPIDIHVPDVLKSKHLECQLLPFQQRAVAWLLSREGVELGEGGRIVPLDDTQSTNASLPTSFFEFKDVEGHQFYASLLYQRIYADLSDVRELEPPVKGGILAEEMGLGKTVEMISLISLHKRELRGATDGDDHDAEANILPSGATLVITPSSILEQWKTELLAHAPKLKVLHYEGFKKTSNYEALLNELTVHDIVLTTYQVLSSEVHYALPSKTRNLRAPKQYQPLQSPLMRVSWWRVCLDEAQMVESGISNAATVARLIPRINAWAVSGTPLRKDVKDLLGLLIFLRYEPYCSSTNLWQRLITADKDSFGKLFRGITLRHSKEKVRDDLRIPPQKRVVITVPFTAIEEQQYTHLFQQMCDDCGFDTTGAPLRDDWDADAPVTVGKMRHWLTRLRQACLHPEVGSHNRRALGGTGGPLRTVNEVLEVMMIQNEAALRTETRAALVSRLHMGQICEYGKETERALGLYLEVLERVNKLVDAARESLTHEVNLELQQATDTIQPAIGDSASEAGDDNDDGHEEHNKRLGTLRNQLRSWLEVQHTCLFFAANTYFQLKTKSCSDEKVTENTQKLEYEELRFYEEAKRVRKELLYEVQSRASTPMKEVARTAKLNKLASSKESKLLSNNGGIESRKMVDQANDLIDLLNRQATQLIKWRNAVVERLILPLVDEEEDRGLETTGDEYETSTKKQDEVYVYMDALRSTIADRHCAITGQRNELINHEMRQVLSKAQEGEGHAPELLVKLMAQRSKFIPDDTSQSIRGLMTNLRSMVTALRWQDGGGSRRAAELHLVEMLLSQLQRISQEQSKALVCLEQELDLFRTTMNRRLEFYRQLQQISDAVAPFKDSMDETLDRDAIRIETSRMHQTDARLESSRTRERFLLHLQSESGNKEGSTELCVICQNTFETGVLTVCGHQYCKDCINLWWKQHRNCPLCKTKLTTRSFHTVTYKPRNIKAQEEAVEQPSDLLQRNPRKTEVRAQGIYSSMPTDMLNQIKSVDITGSFGTKIDTIARHIIWLRSADPGSKSIIFSQYSSFLELLKVAFTRFLIGHTSIDTRNGATLFQKDPGMEVFLLHAKANSSGLNLVNATHVFLCEPLINPAIELQAIARVHRIGQKGKTTVYMYLVEGTVEETIYEISVKRRMAYIATSGLPTSSLDSGTATPTREMAIEVANSLELQKAPFIKLLAKSEGGGEMVNKEDLWACLFSSARSSQRGTAAAALMGFDTETETGREFGRFLRSEAAEERREAGHVEVRHEGV